MGIITRKYCKSSLFIWLSVTLSPVDLFAIKERQKFSSVFLKTKLVAMLSLSIDAIILFFFYYISLKNPMSTKIVSTKEFERLFCDVTGY